MTGSNTTPTIIPLRPSPAQSESVSLRNSQSLEEAAQEVAALAKEADARLLLAATKLVSLKRRIEAGEAGPDAKWMEWLRVHVRLSESYLYQLVKIGEAKDPKKRLESYRKDSREKAKRYNDRHSESGLSENKRLLLKAVRIRVRTRATEIVREGTGWGSAAASSSSAANERALKGAETDATKRALATFGARFGLRLYDKDNPLKSRPSFTLYGPDGSILAGHLSPESYSTGLRQLIELCRNVREVDQLSHSNSITLADLRTQEPALMNAQGTHFADLLLRLLQRKRQQLSALIGASREVDKAASTEDSETSSYRYVGQAHRRRAPFMRSYADLAKDERQSVGTSPTAQTEKMRSDGLAADPSKGPADVSSEGSSCNNAPPTSSEDPLDPFSLEASALIREKNTDSLVALETPDPAKLLPQRIDKSNLFIPLERRLRDKEHLKRVAELPCLVCSRQPSHAHHLRFAQKRGMSQKVSDEYTVPLCGLHHGDLHRSSSEQRWWENQKIEPLAISLELWAKHHSQQR